jgi:hypothetical protein
VLVHGLLHVGDSDVELAHLLIEGSPTRWRIQPGWWRHCISIGSEQGRPTRHCEGPIRRPERGGVNGSW